MWDTAVFLVNKSPINISHYGLIVSFFIVFIFNEANFNHQYDSGVGCWVQVELVSNEPTNS